MVTGETTDSVQGAVDHELQINKIEIKPQSAQTILVLRPIRFIGQCISQIKNCVSVGRMQEAANCVPVVKPPECGQCTT